MSDPRDTDGDGISDSAEVLGTSTAQLAELVPRALAMRVGSLLINPRGLVGGELYLNELESLDGALKRRASPV